MIHGRVQAEAPKAMKTGATAAPTAARKGPRNITATMSTIARTIMYIATTSRTIATTVPSSTPRKPALRILVQAKFLMRLVSPPNRVLIMVEKKSIMATHGDGSTPEIVPAVLLRPSTTCG